ncbi:hypothetical protein RHO14_07785 [Orbus wheelerorum]|uniref:hypothetical protein n=1 Tax=Orbus wheelerorum TaxID=3074111 RepID=UPI00370D2D2B
MTTKDVEEADKKYAACDTDKKCQMQVVKETNELSKQKDRELQDTLNQITNEMGQQMHEAVQFCAGDMECQKSEYDRIRQESRDKWDAYK